MCSNSLCSQIAVNWFTDLMFRMGPRLVLKVVENLFLDHYTLFHLFFEKDRIMTILTIANQKGGVGKTTSAVTLAHGLAMAGQNTLLVDLDPQGHVAFALGMEKAPGLYRLVVDEKTITDITRFS